MIADGGDHSSFSGVHELLGSLRAVWARSRSFRSVAEGGRKTLLACVSCSKENKLDTEVITVDRKLEKKAAQALIASDFEIFLVPRCADWLVVVPMTSAAGEQGGKISGRAAAPTVAPHTSFVLNFVLANALRQTGKQVRTEAVEGAIEFVNLVIEGSKTEKRLLAVGKSDARVVPAAAGGAQSHEVAVGGCMKYSWGGWFCCLVESVGRYGDFNVEMGMAKLPVKSLCTTVTKYRLLSHLVCLKIR